VAAMAREGGGGARAGGAMQQGVMMMDVSDDDEEDDEDKAEEDDEEEDDVAMAAAADGTGAAAKGKAGGKLVSSAGAHLLPRGHRASPEFKALVERVLASGGFEARRPAKMAQEDFLRLLAAFNAAGIHFA